MSILPNMRLINSLVDAIITKTDYAVTEMRTLNGNIVNLAPTIHAHNQSAAGAATERRLNAWTTDFPAIYTDLNEINQRVHAMKRALMRGADEATVLAAAL